MQKNSFLKIAGLMIKREMLLSYRKRMEYIYPLLFFLLIATLFPLATTANPNLLQTMGPGVIWVAALLSTLLSLNHLFRDDYLDGSLEAMILSANPLSFLIMLKLFSQWIVFVLPLIIVAPLLAFLFHLSLYAIGILLISLLLGTPILIFLGSIGAALTVGLRNGGLLMVLMLLPLYVPTLIFASQAVVIAGQGGHIAAPIAWLGALLILTFIVTPMLSAFALRIGVAYD
jgi:heme exporter protein B